MTTTDQQTLYQPRSNHAKYNKLKADGAFVEKEIAQLYDAQEAIFLPDNLLKGHA